MKVCPHIMAVYQEIEQQGLLIERPTSYDTEDIDFVCEPCGSRGDVRDGEDASLEE
jgi:hypothetical protein